MQFKIKYNTMANNELKLETKCYDANEYGYLYGLNQKIPDEEFEKVKKYFKQFKRMDFKEGNIQVTGRPEGWRCLEKDVAKVEEILGITNTLKSRQDKISNAFKDPIKKAKLIDQSYEWLKMLFEKGGTRPKQDLSRLVIHSTKIYDPQDSFKKGFDKGEGELFIYTPHGMWYIINNSGEFADKSLNNVKTIHGGAVGHRLMYEDLIDRLIRIYSEENLYTGEKLY